MGRGVLGAREVGRLFGYLESVSARSRTRARVSLPKSRITRARASPPKSRIPL